MEKTTCILIDQNDKDREKLVQFLTEIGTAEIIAQTSNAKDGLVLVNDLEPNLLFLAVRADDLTSFKFLGKIKKQPTIVFLVNDEASIKTFQTNQLRYLKKPFKPNDVKLLLMDFQKTHQQLGVKMQGLLGKLKFED